MHIIDKPSKYSKEYLEKLFQYTIAEDIANAIIHILGAIFGLYALIHLSWVVGKYGNLIDTFAYIFYGLSILFMFLMSSLYHSMLNHTARSIFKKLDHISIYILILGSYTPFIFSALKTHESYYIYLFLFLTALCGIIFKIFIVGKFKIISTILYVFMGWAGIWILPQIISICNHSCIFYLFLGGIFYTVGALIYAFVKFKFSHAIWHVFVIFGVLFQFISINFFILQYR